MNKRLEAKIVQAAKDLNSQVKMDYSVFPLERIFTGNEIFLNCFLMMCLYGMKMSTIWNSIQIIVKILKKQNLSHGYVLKRISLKMVQFMVCR